MTFISSADGPTPAPMDVGDMPTAAPTAPLVCFFRHGATYEACDSDKVSCEPGVPEYWDPAGAYRAIYLLELNVRASDRRWNMPGRDQSGERGEEHQINPLTTKTCTPSTEDACLSMRWTITTPENNLVTREYLTCGTKDSCGTLHACTCFLHPKMQVF